MSIWYKAILPIADELGYPATIKSMLSNQDDLRLPEVARTTAFSMVPDWHSWADIGGVLGTGAEAGQIWEHLTQLSTRQQFEKWKLDITDIEGLCASKSPLDQHSTLDDFAEARASHLINPLTLPQLRACLDHDQVKITRPTNNADYLLQYSWDGRIFLANDGGSHHFAAARYIASKLNTPVSLEARLYRYCMNSATVRQLCDSYEIFALPSDLVLGGHFCIALRRMGAEYYFTPLPNQYRDFHAVFLPKNKVRSMRVANVLRQSGVTDLGQHLTLLAQGAKNE